ncbi:MAG: glycosyltransferase family 1 protein [Desulfurococcaceae archaeon]
MKICINALPLLPPRTGVGRYTYHLINTIRTLYPTNDYYYFYHGKISTKLPEEDPLFPFLNKLKTLLKRTPFIHLFRPLLLRSLSSPEDVFDVYLEPNFIPLPGIKAKLIIAVVHDFSFHLYPEWHPEDRVSFFSKHFWREIKRADFIVCVSKTIREEAVSLGLPREKLRWIYPGIDHAIFHRLPETFLRDLRKMLSLPPHFLLYVGTLEPRKNLKFLLETYATFPLSFRRTYPLFLIGPKGWKLSSFSHLFSTEGVKVLGYVEDTLLAVYYNLATLLIYPSLYEGFGFPPLEAMACGCPALVSDIPVFREVYEDSAIYFDLSSSASLKEKIQMLVEDQESRVNYRQRALAHVKKFFWETTAQKLAELFNAPPA